jgi:hypothetical protein
MPSQTVFSLSVGGVGTELRYYLFVLIRSRHPSYRHRLLQVFSMLIHQLRNVGLASLAGDSLLLAFSYGRIVDKKVWCL